MKRDSDELCDKLCLQRARRVRNWVSTSVSPLSTGTVCRVSGHDALVLSRTTKAGQAYTAAVTQCKTKDVAAAAAEGAPLMGIQTNDPRITLVAGGYPLFVDGKRMSGPSALAAVRKRRTARSPNMWWRVCSRISTEKDFPDKMN